MEMCPILSLLCLRNLVVGEVARRIDEPSGMAVGVKEDERRIKDGYMV